MRLISTFTTFGLLSFATLSTYALPTGRRASNNHGTTNCNLNGVLHEHNVESGSECVRMGGVVFRPLGTDVCLDVKRAKDTAGHGSCWIPAPGIPVNVHTRPASGASSAIASSFPREIGPSAQLFPRVQKDEAHPQTGTAKPASTIREGQVSQTTADQRLGLPAPMGPRTPRRQRQPTNGQSHPPLGGSQTAQASGSNLASPPRVQTAEPQPNSHLTNGAQNTQDPHREIQITDLDQLLRRPDPPNGPRARSRPNHTPLGGSQTVTPQSHGPDIATSHERPQAQAVEPQANEPGSASHQQPPQGGSQATVVNWNQVGKYPTVHPSGPRLLTRPQPLHEGSQLASQSHESDSTSPHEHSQQPESHASDSDLQAQSPSNELNVSSHLHENTQAHAAAPEWAIVASSSQGVEVESPHSQSPVQNTAHKRPAGIRPLPPQPRPKSPPPPYSESDPANDRNRQGASHSSQ
ncbi:hypothetical protein H0H92_003844 [Tricholoma furcatifolium]|nr:hypothetical protein H0H92_003844 [Tricholoma furcatifolium]